MFIGTDNTARRKYIVPFQMIDVMEVQSADDVNILVRFLCSSSISLIEGVRRLQPNKSHTSDV